jgi:L-fucose mutarotase
MEVVGDPDEVPHVQRAFLEVVSRAAGRDVRMGSLSRFDFYERVRGAFAVVATSEARPYGCFLITTGVV